jgi:uncharacterized membrane protein YtjA (UPF0391 family)
LQSSRTGTFSCRQLSIVEDAVREIEEIMLNLVVTLLIIALIAAVLGFGGIAIAAVGIAKIVFFVALVLFLVAALAGMLRGPAAL